MGHNNKELYVVIGVSLLLIFLFCSGLIALAEQLDTKRPDVHYNGLGYQRVPIARYVWDPKDHGMISVKIGEFKWNEDRSLICVPVENQHEQYSCFPPSTAVFE